MGVYENEKHMEREVTAIVCHWSLLLMDSLVPSAKALTSLGKRRSWAKVWAMRPPSPFSHTRMQVSAGKGMPSNLKLGCHVDTGRVEDATCISTWAGGLWMVTPLDGWGGVQVWASQGLADVCSLAHGLLWGRAGGEGVRGWARGVWPHPWGGYYCVV